MRYPRFIAHLAVLVVPLVLASFAEAQQTEADASIEIAKEYMEVGQALYAAGKFEEAAGNFLKAFEAQPFAAFLFNAGVAYEKAGNTEKAIYYFQRYIEEEPGAPDVPSIEERIAQLTASAPAPGQPDQPPTFIVEKTCGGEGQPPCECGGEGQPPCEGGGTAAPAQVTEPSPAMKSLVKVRTKPDGAKVIVSDMQGNALYTGKSPLHQTLEPGTYELKVEHPEYKAAVTPITVSEGRVYVVVVELSQGTFLGYLKVKSNVPGSKVFIDDKDAGAVGVTPWGAPVPTGDHTVWIERPGYVSVEKKVSLGVGDTFELDVDLSRVEHGELHVVANVDFAILAVDGKPAGGELGKGLVLEFPAGTHEVLVQAKGLKAYLATIDVQKGMRTKVLVRMNPKPSRKPAWVSLGLATAFLAAGIAFAVQSERMYDDLLADKRAGFLDNNDPRLHETLGWSIGADFSFLLASVMTVVGLVYMFRDPLPDTEGMVKDPIEFAELPEYSK